MLLSAHRTMENLGRGQRWMEVVRHRRDTWRDVCIGEGAGDPDRGTAEGVDYGCWFSPMVGSGVFVELGRALWVSDRHELEGLLHLDPETHDCLYAKRAHARNFDSIIIAQSLRDSRPEVIVTAGGCMTQTEPLPDACVPTSAARRHSFLLRTGWAASVDCTCHPGQWLNCVP